ncbi:MAG: M3 family metallopeptidase [Chlorobi bacterium]|nr:M3 family metallopeptidase [Chlorobiota bacterium]
MKKLFLVSFILIGLIMSCNNVEKQNHENPFFSEYNTPFHSPDFSKIENKDYLPAYKKGIEEQQKEIASIVNNPQVPDFHNTIEALEFSGELLRKVDNVFDNLTSSVTGSELQSIEKEVAPMLSKNHDDIRLNNALFQRIKTVYNQKDSLQLTPEQQKLLEETYKEFVRGGANLSETDKEKLREINKKLSVLSLKFGENLLAENNNFKLIIDNEKDLAGLPEAVKAGALEAGKETGNEGKWVFTLHKPSFIPFLQYADNRSLREKVFKAYTMMGNNNDEFDNKATISKLVNLRLEKARLLGYNNYAEFVLDDNMAKKPENVYKLLNQLMVAALPIAKKEAAELQKMIDEEGNNFKLEPWDWWYYAEKLKKAKYDLNDEVLKPYFELEHVKKGLFEVINKLYGLKFVERNDIPKYHKDVQVYEVQEADGSHVGLLFMDFYPRPSKRSGAWMNAFRKQMIKDGKNITPIITTVFNFTKPAGNSPALLTFEEASTMYHEVGHALHGLLSKCTYNSLSGTSVARDFVELPSQFMENWASAPEVLKKYAVHYKTGEVIPQELIDKIEKSSHFNQGFAMVEYLAASFLDMDWHTVTEVKNYDVNAFEAQSMKNIGMIPEIVVRYRSPYFAHIFKGGYSAGYYSYVWAEILDADAFEAFKENGIFDRKTATAFRKNILEKGGTGDEMEEYIAFRGKEPTIDALLKRKGIKE